MGIMGVLFNPNGRIQANKFWQGVIVLVGFQIVFAVLPVLGLNIQIIASFLGFAIIYPYLCVYGKRLHDSNKTAWMFLLFAFGYFVIALISFFFTPGVGEFFSEYMALAQEGDEEAMQALQEQFQAEANSGGAVIVQLGGLLVANLLLGFIAARMYSDPNTNKYGPPVGSEGISSGGASNAGDDDIFS